MLTLRIYTTYMNRFEDSFLSTEALEKERSDIEDFYKSKYDVHYYVLDMNRERLYDRINRRVDIMFENGLLEECIKLKENGYNSSMQAMQGIGYKEVLLYLENSITLEEAIEMIKQGSRNYAKRQLTWFRRNKALGID